VKILYNKRGSRMGGGDRHPFAFFAIGTIVILAAVFFIGLQVGRVVEKNAAPPEPASAKGPDPPAAQASNPKEPGNEIRKELGAFSQDAAKVPVVPPPDAKTTVEEVEKRLTFQESLPKKEDSPLPLVKASRSDVKAVPRTSDVGTRKYAVQVGAFREKGTAESLRRKLEKAGYTPKVMVSAGKKKGQKIHRLVLGPFTDKAAARKAASKLKSEFKINAFVTPG